MACIIGMTTDPERRKQEWKRKHPGLRNWRILKRNLSKEQAQEEELKLARQFGCDSDPGGRKSEKGALYAVYTFEY